MRRSTLIGCVLALASPLAGTSDAMAMIQIDRGIAGARLGASPAQVRAALGKPTKTTPAATTSGRGCGYTFAGGIGVFFQGAGGRRRCRSRGSATGRRRASAIGSTQADVVANVPRVECETVETALTCHTRDLLPGQQVTDFRIEDGKVVRVTVAIVID